MAGFPRVVGSDKQIGERLFACPAHARATSLAVDMYIWCSLRYQCGVCGFVSAMWTLRGRIPRGFNFQRASDTKVLKYLQLFDLVAVGMSSIVILRFM